MLLEPMKLASRDSIGLMVFFSTKKARMSSTKRRAKNPA
jgi:hypothetical protein